MKKIAKMNKDELILLAEENEVDADDSMTKEEIKAALFESGVDDDFLEQKAQEVKQEASSTAPAETEDEVLVRMTAKTKWYSYGSYTFTRDNPFEVMKKEDAEKIIKANPDSFRKASEDEIRRFFG